MASITFRLAYRPEVAGGTLTDAHAEMYPLRVHVYGTHELTRAGANKRSSSQIFEISAPSSAHEFDCVIRRLEGARPFAPYARGGAYKEERVSDGTLAASTSIVVRASATTVTAEGQQCLTPVGVAVVPLATLLQRATVTTSAVLVRNHDSSSGYVPAAPLRKGTVLISSVRASNISLRAATPLDLDSDEAREAKTLRTMAGIINRNMSFFFGAKAQLARPTVPALRPFHCPVYTTERQPLIAQAYATLRPSEPLDVRYYEQLMRIGAARSGFARKRTALTRLVELVARGRGTDEQSSAALSFVVRALSAYALAMVYLPDVVNRNVSAPGRAHRSALVEDTEDFKVPRRFGGDDCEGVALETHMHVRALQLADDNVVARMSPLLRAVRSLLRLYVSTLTLGCVTNAKMTTAKLDASKVMAHTFNTWIPYWRLYQASAISVRNKFDNSRLYAERADELQDAIDARLPVVIAEGTAPIDPAMRAVSEYYSSEQHLKLAREAIAARSAFAQQLIDLEAPFLQIEVFGAPQEPRGDLSQFYKYPTSFTTADFLDIGYDDFALVYNRDDARKRTYGVRLRTLLREPFEVMPTLGVSADEARLCDAVLLDQEPVPLLRAPSTSARPTQEFAEQRALCAQILDPVARERPATTVLRDTQLHQRRQVAFMRAQDVTADALQRIAYAAKQSGVRAFSYEWWTLSEPVDGSCTPTTVVDFYFELL